MSPIPESILGNNPVHTLYDNEIKAIALTIGRELSKLAWYDMSAIQAEKWCKIKAREHGAITSFDIDDIVYLAMNYVIGEG